MKRLQSFDVVKAFACMAIVVLHFRQVNTSGLSICIQALTRFAVPTFLMISGFFLFGAVDERRACRALRKIVLIVLSASVFYLFFHTVFVGWTMNSCAKIFSRAHVLEFFFTNRPFVYLHLWYLGALIYCYITVLLLWSSWGKRLLCCALPFLLIGMAFSQEFKEAAPIVPSIRVAVDFWVWWGHIYLFRALPFFVSGFLLAAIKSKLANVPRIELVCILMALLGCVSSLLEAFFIKSKDVQFYIGSYVTALALVAWASQCQKSCFGVLSYIGLRLSLLVYILHIAVGNMYNRYLAHACDGALIKSTLRPLGVLLCTLIVSQIVLVLWRLLALGVCRLGYGISRDGHVGQGK